MTAGELLAPYSVLEAEDHTTYGWRGAGSGERLRDWEERGKKKATKNREK